MPNKNITSIDKNTNPYLYSGTNYCPTCGSKMLSPENDWIKLIDGSSFPPVGENVIVTYVDDSSDNRNYYTDVGWWTGVDKMFVVDNDMNYSVTHWKKMPEPCRDDVYNKHFK